MLPGRGVRAYDADNDSVNKSNLQSGDFIGKYYIYFTIKNCDKTFLKIILRLKKLLKGDDVSTLAERHYQVKIS